MNKTDLPTCLGLSSAGTRSGPNPSIILSWSVPSWTEWNLSKKHVGITKLALLSIRTLNNWGGGKGKGLREEVELGIVCNLTTRRFPGTRPRHWAICSSEVIFRVNLVPSEGNPPTFSQLMCLYLQQKDLTHFHQAVDSDLFTYNTDEDNSASLSKCWGAVWGGWILRSP